MIDIDSTDDTARGRGAHGARVVHHRYVPIAEAARVTVAPQARHDWLLVVDPDEEVPPALSAEVAAILPTLGDDVAAVDAPRQYYFGGRRLSGTVWGGPNKRRLLVHRGRVELHADDLGRDGDPPRAGRSTSSRSPTRPRSSIVGRADIASCTSGTAATSKLEPVDRVAAGRSPAGALS